MPFQREAYRSDLSGTIADLMGRSTANQAELVRANAAIQARAAEQRGQNTAQLFGTIGQLAQGTIGQIRQDRLDAPRREAEQLHLADARRQDAEAKRGAQNEQWLRTRLGDTTQPPPSFEELAGVLGPKDAMAIHQGFQAITDRDLQDQTRTLELFGRDLVAVKAMPAGMRPEMWTAVRQRWAGHRMPDGMMPEQYDDQVLDALLKRGQKAPEPFTLTQGQTRYDANGQVLAAAPSRPVAVAPGATLINPDNPQAGPVYTAPVKEEHSPAYKEWLDYKATGGTSTFEQYQTADANRRRPVVNVSTQPAAGDFDLTGDAFLATIPKEWRNTVRKIANYEEDPTKSVGMRSGMRDKVVQWVNQVNPGYKADEFAVRGPTRKAFTTGVQGQQINAINTAIGHIDQLTGLADKLQNGGFVPGNAAFNAVRTMFGGESVTNFDTLKDALAGEVSSVLAKGGATVSGIAEAKEKIHGSNSPAQLAGYVKTLIPIMGSKLASLDYQYHQAMGADDSYSALSPESRMILSKHGFDPAQHDGRDRSTKGDPMGIR